MNTPLDYEVGTQFVYSDLSMVTMQAVIERITGMGLNEFVKEQVFEPLGMKHTMYLPPLIDQA